MRYLLALLALAVFLNGNTAAEFRPLVLDSTGKTRQFPNGTDTLRVVPSYGLAANVPTASADNTGQIYITTDTKTILRSNGTTWESVTLPSGTAGGDLAGTYPNPTVTGAADNVFTLYDNTDPTKGFAWTLGNQTTGTTLTLNSGAQSASRQLSIPVLSGNDTVAVIGQAQTFTGAQTFSTPIASTSGGTGINNAGTITNASNTTITGGGTFALGGFTFTVPATGTADLIGTAQTITAAKTYSDAEIITRGTNNTSASATHIRLERGTGAGADATINTTGDASNGVASANITVNGSATSFASTGVTFAAPVIAPTATTSIPSIRLPHGTAPSSPTNGDIWTTTSGAYVRVNGATVGPLIDASGGGAVSALYAKFTSGTALNLNAAGSATLNRMHRVFGTSADFDITISGLSPSTGDVLGFYVEYQGAASKAYRLDAGGTVRIAGRTRYLTLLHTNVCVLRYDGADWNPLALSLDTPWIDAGAVTIQAVTSNPTKASGIGRDRMQWRRVGNSLEMKVDYYQTNTTSAAAGTGDYLIVIPIGAINTTLVEAETGASSAQIRARMGEGYGHCNGSGPSGAMGFLVYDTTRLRFGTASNFFGSANSPLSGANFAIRGCISVPITDW